MRRPTCTAVRGVDTTVRAKGVSGQIREASLSLLYFQAVDCLRVAAGRAHATFFAPARHKGDVFTWGRPAPTPATVKVRAMARGSRQASKTGAVAIGGLLALGLLGITPQPAAAQGLFGTLFGGFDSPAERSARYRDSRLPVRSYAPSDYDRRDPYQGHGFPFFGGPRSEPREARPAAPAHGGTVHCVRMCDGRYFPVPRSAGGVRLDPAKVCSALCPAATTKVFHGGDMQYARASDGERYASMENAFAFRERIVPDCSCTGKGPGGLAQIDIESDPTLRAGDVVVTAEGPAVFNGSRQFPYQTADLTPIDDYGRLNRNLREKLAELQVNTQVEPVVPPQRIDVTPAQKPTRTARVRTSEGRDQRRAPPRQVRPQQRQYQPRYAEPPRYERPQRSAQQGFPLFRLW